MLFVTDVGERITVKCGCGHFSLSLRNRGQAAPGAVRCPICGARAPLGDLVQAWRGRPARWPETKARESARALAERA